MKIGSNAVKISKAMPASTKGAKGMPKLFKIEVKIPRTSRNFGAINIGVIIAKNPRDLTKFMVILWPIRWNKNPKSSSFSLVWFGLGWDWDCILE